MSESRLKRAWTGDRLAFGALHAPICYWDYADTCW